MEKLNNWENVKPVEQGSGNSLPAGAYVVKILNVENVEKKQYLKIEFDIYEGEYKGYFSKLKETKKKWYGNYYRTYDEKSASYFKSFITAIERSNANYKWDFDETKLIGKVFCLSFGYEEYEADDGSIKKSLRPRYAHSVEALKKGEVKTPKTKELIRNIPYQPNPIFQVYEKQVEDKPKIDIKDDDLPF